MILGGRGQSFQKRLLKMFKILKIKEVVKLILCMQLHVYSSYNLTM